MKKSFVYVAVAAAMLGQAAVASAQIDPEVQQLVDSLNTKVDILNQANAENLQVITGQINRNQDTMHAHKREQNEVNSGFSADINANKQAAQQAQAKADQAQQDNQRQEAAINANKAEIAANKQAAEQAQSKADQAQLHNQRQDEVIAQNQGAIASNTQAISDVRNQMTQTYQGLSSVNHRIDHVNEKLEKGLASQAALAGLFQPYSVGKFNVTAALGGYGSQQAVAVGTGYRFNENFAMKAAVAGDTSDFAKASYNVGVNFEW